MVPDFPQPQELQHLHEYPEVQQVLWDQLAQVIHLILLVLVCQHLLDFQADQLVLDSQLVLRLPLILEILLDLLVQRFHLVQLDLCCPWVPSVHWFLMDLCPLRVLEALLLQLDLEYLELLEVLLVLLVLMHPVIQQGQDFLKLRESHQVQDYPAVL